MESACRPERFLLRAEVATAAAVDTLRSFPSDCVSEPAADVVGVRSSCCVLMVAGGSATSTLDDSGVLRTIREWKGNVTVEAIRCGLRYGRTPLTPGKAAGLGREVVNYLHAGRAGSRCEDCKAKQTCSK